MSSLPLMLDLQNEYDIVADLRDSQSIKEDK